MQVRIGIANATKELELDVEDAGAVITAYHDAMKKGEAMLSLVEQGGNQTILAVGAILYISIDAPGRGGIGFSAEA